MQLLRHRDAVNVGELEELLALLPADMPVHISAGGGCRHVTQVDKQDRRRMDPDVHAASGGGPLLADGRLPAALVLRADFGGAAVVRRLG